jgi:hypothetical protein
MVRSIVSKHSLKSACLLICAINMLALSTLVAASSVSIQLGNPSYNSYKYQQQRHNTNNGHHAAQRNERTYRNDRSYRNDRTYRPAINIGIEPNRHHYSSSNSRNRYHDKKKNNYSPNRYYSSPSKKYYGQEYIPGQFDSRFPNSYRQPIYRPVLRNQGYRRNYNHTESAWEILAEGQTRLALRQFAIDAQAYPKAGLPKIGYALSSAASGKMKQSTEAMRRAFKIDSESLYYQQYDLRLHPMIHQVRSKFQHKLKRRGRETDAAFMVAALSYMIGDYSSTYYALKRAHKDGDRSRSYKNLMGLANDNGQFAQQTKNSHAYR